MTEVEDRSNVGAQEATRAKKAVEKRIHPRLGKDDFPTAHILPFGKTVHDRFTVEIARGCTRGCRFCVAGMTSRPVRERSLEEIDSLLQQGLNKTGYEELSFLSLSSGDFSQLEGLFQQSFARCSREQVAISLPSLRAGSLSPFLMSLLARLRRTGATLAPEAGSQRLRNVINKGISQEQILEHAAKLFRLGWTGIKLYFMIGLPTETKEDLDAILDLCRKVRQASGSKAKRLQITASVAPFVPKPHTPFQWEPQATRQEIQAKIDYLRALFKPHKRLTLRWHDPEMSWLEGVFSRGDRSLAAAVEQAYESGDLLTSWSDYFAPSLWKEVFSRAGIDADAYLEARKEDQDLPWGQIVCGVSKQFLLRERSRALAEKITPDCRYQACQSCGVCSRDSKGSLLREQSRETYLAPRINQSSRDQENEELERSIPESPDLSRKALHVGLWFEKTGPAAYLSQLELQTLLARIMRRAGLPLTFSQGFHPKPLMSFGRALPVGVASCNEWCTLFLRENQAFKEILDRLNAESLQGLRFHAAQQMDPGKKPKPALQEKYELVFTAAKEKTDYAMRTWEEILQLESVPISYRSKKGLKQVDARPHLAAVESLDAASLYLTFDWQHGYLSPLKIVQAIHPELSPLDFQLSKMKQL